LVRASTLRQRAREEFQAFWLTAFYLWIVLGSFTIYRRLVLAETGVPYLHYGISLVEALVVAKVILVGKMFGFSRCFEQKPLIVPVIYKSILFGLLVLLFAILEHVIEGMIRSHSAFSGLLSLASLGVDELLARVLVILIAFLPFFAFCEMGRVIGTQRLFAMFLRTPDHPSAPTD
jgi:hypothetical protein